MKTKTCSTCYQEKSLDNYYFIKRLDDYGTQCKKCLAVVKKRNRIKQCAKFDAGLVNIPQFKTCSKCKLSLSADNFIIRKGTRDGLSSDCRICSARDKKARRERIKLTLVNIIPSEKVCSKCGENLPSSSFWRNPSYADGLFPNCKKCNTQSVYEYELQRKYGINITTYNEMLKEQNNKCAICGKSFEEFFKETGKRLYVDHCHKTGKVRGLLCHKCNSVLGFLQDDLNYLKQASLYLQRSLICLQ